MLIPGAVTILFGLIFILLGLAAMVSEKESEAGCGLFAIATIFIVLGIAIATIEGI